MSRLTPVTLSVLLFALAWTQTDALEAQNDYVDTVVPESQFTAATNEDPPQPLTISPTNGFPTAKASRVYTPTAHPNRQCGSCPLDGSPLKPSFENLLEQRDEEGYCSRSLCSAICHCKSKVRSGHIPKKSKEFKFSLPEVCCPITKTIKGCETTLEFCLTVKDGSKISAFNMKKCEAGIGVCTGVFAKTLFDVSVKLSASCEKEFEYEQEKEITLFSQYGVEALVIPAFSLNFESGLNGWVKMTVPGEVIIRPDFYPKNSEATMKKPSFEWGVEGTASVSAEISLGLEVNALKVVTAGFYASASIGGSAELSLKGNSGKSSGKLGGKKVKDVTLKASAEAKFAASVGITLAWPDNLPTEFCGANLLPWNDDDELELEGFGTEVTLFEKSVDVKLG